ncbi:MAG TPA: hypothetical protein VF791_15035 [Pyrinomonadaceae bacterium]
MKIENFKDPATNRYKWRAGEIGAGQRHYPVADTKDELADILDAIRKKARTLKYRLEVEPEHIQSG